MTMEEVVIGRWLSEAAMCRKWCDVSILCGGRHFWAHRLVLSTASPFIRGLLLSRPSDDIPTTIVFADFSFEIVEALLQYIYSGEVSVLSEHVDDFLTLSQALQIHVDASYIINKQKLNNDNIKEKEDCYFTKMLPKKSNGIKSESCNKNLDLEILIKSDKISKSISPPNNCYKEATKSIEVPKKNLALDSIPRIFPPEKLGINGDALNLTNIPRQNGFLGLNGSSQYLRNEKLVRPIPSLMPIDCLTAISNMTEIKSPVKRIPDLLDLTSVKNSYNYNSAFERVNNYPAHSKTASDTNQGLFDYHRPLRLGFTNIPNTPKSDDAYINERKRCQKNVPQNRVMESPWSTRGPICYQKKFRRKDEHEIMEAVHENVSQLRNTPSNDQIIPGLLDITSNNVSKNNEIVQIKKFNDDNNNDFEKIKRVQLIENNDDIQLVSVDIKKVSLEPLDKNIKFDKKNNFLLTNILENHKIYPVDPVVKVDDFIKTESSEEISSSTVKSIDPKDDSDDTFKCSTCTKVFSSQSALLEHASTHVSRARYRCDTCDKSFSQLRNYKYHVSVHRGTKEFAATCNVCGKYFNDRGYLSSHMKIHRNRKEYQCPHCPKSFNQRVAYNMHVRIHTGVKPHQCEACGKAFSRKMLLKQHSRTHSGEKPYACSACGKRFADRSNMTLHMRLHSGVKPFSCNLCPKSFTKKHHLKTHLNYHTGNKPYACSKCGLTFSQSSNMRTHMKKCLVAVEDVNNLTETLVM